MYTTQRKQLMRKNKFRLHKKMANKKEIITIIICLLDKHHQSHPSTHLSSLTDIHNCLLCVKSFFMFYNYYRNKKALSRKLLFRIAVILTSLNFFQFLKNKWQRIIQKYLINNEDGKFSSCYCRECKGRLIIIYSQKSSSM